MPPRRKLAGHGPNMDHADLPGPHTGAGTSEPQSRVQFSPQGYLVRLPGAGGNGGGPFDHALWAAQRGTHLGCGGLILDEIQFHSWRPLCRTIAWYRRCDDGSPAGVCERVEGPHQARIAVPPEEDTNPQRPLRFRVEVPLPGSARRVARLRAYCGGVIRHQAGGACVNALVVDLAGVPDSGAHTTTNVNVWPDILSSSDNPVELVLPEGVALAGLHGHNGDSLDKLGLYVCPAAPSRWTPAAHALCPPPFRAQVRALLCSLRFGEPMRQWQVGLPNDVALAIVEALFTATFLSPGAGGDMGSDCIADWFVGTMRQVRWVEVPRPPGEGAIRDMND